MHLLFPSNPFDKSAVDEDYADEFNALVAAGFSFSLFSFEDFEAGQFRAKPTLPTGEEILYRGWMLAPAAYARLCNAISGQGAVAKTSPEDYRRCHHLPEWYPLYRDVTPDTVVTDRDADFVAALQGKDWPAYFVKDYVKSLTTQRGSVASRPEEVAEIVSLIEQYRGAVEGGICIREFENLLVDTEERYFVFNGKAYGRNDVVPSLVDDVASRMSSPFFSVDVITSKEGKLRLIELGDGQVSDKKKWTAEKFAAMLSQR